MPPPSAWAAPKLSAAELDLHTVAPETKSCNGMQVLVDQACPVNLGLSFGAAGADDVMYRRFLRIPDMTLPVAPGGNGDLVYTLSPLPEGLAFDADART